MQNEKLEVWLRGPLSGVPALLQPAAHALLQALEEISALESKFPNSLLWERPYEVASVGFHLQHLTGVLDRLLTYARNESLTDSQLAYLNAEGKEPFTGCTYENLVNNFKTQVSKSIDQMSHTDEISLTEIRYVGRARIPSTHLGLIFHAAEHSQRHVGQMLVTARILMFTKE